MSIAVGRGRDRSIGFGRANILVPDLWKVAQPRIQSGNSNNEPVHNGEEAPKLDNISNNKDQRIKYLLVLGSAWSRDDDNDSDDAKKRDSYVDPVKDGLPEGLRNKCLNKVRKERVGECVSLLITPSYEWRLQQS